MTQVSDGLKQQIVMRQLMRAAEITTRQHADFPGDHAWEEVDSAVHDVQFTLLALWGYKTLEELMGPRESWRGGGNERSTHSGFVWPCDNDPGTGPGDRSS